MPRLMPPGLRMAVLARAHRQRMDARLEKDDLTSAQLRVLGDIMELEDAGVPEINQRALEKSVRVTHPTMTGLIQRLEAKGLVRTMPSPTDRRYKKIVSTEKARHFQQQVATQDQLIFEELCRGLPPEDIAAFYRITDVMLANLDRQGETQGK